MKTPKKQVTVYVPVQILDLLAQLAQRERRSVNAQIVWILEQYLNNQGSGK